MLKVWPGGYKVTSSLLVERIICKLFMFENKKNVTCDNLAVTHYLE